MEGCDHNHDSYPRRSAQIKQSSLSEMKLPAPAKTQTTSNENSGHPAPDTEQATKPKSRIEAELSEPSRPIVARYLRTGRDGGGTSSGANTPHELSDNESSDEVDTVKPRGLPDAVRNLPQRQATKDDIQRWARESGMGNGTKADALGDEPDEDETENEDEHAISGKDLDQAEQDDKGLRGSVY